MIQGEMSQGLGLVCLNFEWWGWVYVSSDQWILGQDLTIVYMFVFDCSDVCLHCMWERGKAKGARASPPSKFGTWNGCLFLYNLWTLMICTGHDKQNRVALGSKCVKPIHTSILFLSPFPGMWSSAWLSELKHSKN
jgi:hypothetical protein